MSPYPPAPWAPHPVYQPEPNNYLVQAGPYPYAAEYIRQVGGTTWHWAAHAWRNVPNDFRTKSLYDVRVDWPMTYEDLEPFYQEAEEIMGVSGAPNTGSRRKIPFPMGTGRGALRDAPSARATGVGLSSRVQHHSAQQPPL